MNTINEGRMSILSDLWHLRERLDNNMLLWLLLLRKLSPSYSPPEEELAIEAQPQNGIDGIGDVTATAWDMIVERQGGSYVAVLKEAIRRLARKHNWIGELLEDMDIVAEDEQAMEDAVRLFTNLPEDISLEFVYETLLRWEPEELPVTNGDFYTPKQVIACMQDIVNADASLYDPCCGSGALLAAVPRAAERATDLYGQTMDARCRTLTRMNLIMCGLDVDLGPAPANTLALDVHQSLTFNAIVANPPFNQKNWYRGINYRDKRWHYGLPPRGNANFAWLQHILSKLEEGCIAAVIMPNSTLTTINVRERTIRQRMLEDGVVQAIITLPPNLFYTTKIPVCIWVLKKKSRKKQAVLFIDLPRLMKVENKTFEEAIVLPAVLLKEWEKERMEHREGVIAASFCEIQAYDYSLSPNHYSRSCLPYIPLAPDAWETPRLIIRLLCMEGSLAQDTAECIKALTYNTATTSWQKASIGALYNIFGGLSIRKPEYGTGTPLVDVKTILHNHFVPRTQHICAVVEQAKREKHNIRRGDVLINRTSENLEQLGCGCVADEDVDAVFVGFAKRLRPRGAGDTFPVYHRYAAGYFRSRVYRGEVEHNAPVFTTRASLKENDIARISLYYPAMERQKQIGDALYAIHEAFQNATPRGQFMLQELQKLFVENLITNPILQWKNEGMDGR